jgi:hypothetical protein
MPKVPAIVLDLDSKGIATQSTKDAKVRFDWDADGLADQTSWIGTTEAFLFLDSDGNGTVSGPGEISFWGDGGGSDAAFKAYDTNKDGILSALDTGFNSFMLWTDKNGNGVVEAGEVLGLATAGVRAIGANLAASGETDVGGAASTLFKGSFTRTNGTTQALAELSIGYVSAPKDGLPKLSFLAQSLDREGKKYGIAAKDGQIVVTGKHLEAIDARAGGLNGATDLSFRDRSVGMLSAIILDLEGNGVTMERRTKSHASFDMDGDGASDDTGWTRKGDGFLVIDRDHDGRITNGSELSFLSENPSAKNSLAGLLSLDSNGDRILDKNDARLGELKVWMDSNGNGVGDEGELKSLTELGLVSIDLNPHNLGGTAKIGENLLLATATFTRADGTVGTLGDAALAFKAGGAPYAPAAGSRGAAPVLPADPATAEDPVTGEPRLPTRRARPEPSVPLAPDSLFTLAANQLASAIAAFGAPETGGEIDPGRDAAVQPPLIAPPATHF